MSETRSPRDRLRAIRAGRVSQLLDPEPNDGLPPTAPPRLTLNDKPVQTGAAFDAGMARAHSLKVDAALNALAAANTNNKSSKQRATYPPGGGTVPPLPPTPFTVPIAPLVALTIAPLIGGLGVEMANRKDLNNILRQLSDETIDLSHLLQFPQNDNERSTAFTPIDVDTTPSPTPAEAPKIRNKLTGPLLDDPEPTELGKTPPFPGEPLEAIDTLPPKDWDEFNQPQKESIPILEVDWRHLILYHGSSPETEQDTTFVINTLKKLLIEFGFTPAENWGGRERERYFPGPDGGRKGSRYADAAVGVRIGDKLYVINANTISVLKDGTPTRYERDAETDLNEKIRTSQEEHTPSLLMIRKSRGMPRADWEIQTEEGLRRFLRTWIDSLVK